LNKIWVWIPVDFRFTNMNGYIWKSIQQIWIINHVTFYNSRILWNTINWITNLLNNWYELRIIQFWKLWVFWCRTYYKLFTANITYTFINIEFNTSNWDIWNQKRIIWFFLLEFYFNSLLLTYFPNIEYSILLSKTYWKRISRTIQVILACFLN
jgi:hypothetical protein